MQLDHLKKPLALAGLACAIALAPTYASAVDFTGKKIIMITPFKPGGGGDTYSRTFGSAIGQYLPGKPVIVVFNKPGGSGIIGYNWFESNAKPDGLTFTLASTSTYTTQMFGGKKVKFDLGEWRAIITNPIGTTFYARPDQTGITGKDLKADILTLQKGNLVYSSKSKASAGIRSMLAFDLLGFFPSKVVFGLSSGKRRKAMLRGELNLSQDNSVKYLKSVRKWEKKGEFIGFMSFGMPTPGGKIIRDPAVPKLPTIEEGYKTLYGKGPDKNSQHWKAIEKFTLLVATSKSLMLPKGTPDDIYNAYVKAARKMWADPAFQKRIKKTNGKYPAYFGKEAQTMVHGAIKWNPKLRKWLDKWLEKKLDKST
jgi:tripartite-type tricarboxylate transporter receptor subunit TctC